MQIVFIGENLMEIICMKCQNLFSGKNKKNISKCHLLKIVPRVVLSINFYDAKAAPLYNNFYGLKPMEGRFYRVHCMYVL